MRFTKWCWQLDKAGSQFSSTRSVWWPSCRSRRTNSSRPSASALNAVLKNSKLSRLTFCLLGVATPSELLRDPRTTPFNIGRRIDLYDFREEEAAILALGLGRDKGLASLLMKRIFYWTCGHPYLTQRLCQAVKEDPSVVGPSGVDRICEQLFFARDKREQERNFKEVERQMLGRGKDVTSVLDLYRRVYRWQSVRAADNVLNKGKGPWDRFLSRINFARVHHDARTQRRACCESLESHGSSKDTYGP